MASLLGRPLVMHVYERVRAFVPEGRCVILVDELRNFNEISRYTDHVLMTSRACPNGTARCRDGLISFANKTRPTDIVLNIQADEPLVTQDHLKALVAPFRSGVGDSDADEDMVSTLVYPVAEAAEYDQPNRVKAFVDDTGQCVDFARHVTDINASRLRVFIHGGFYAYRVRTLERIARLEPVEKEIELGLEQMRFLAHNIPIRGTLCQRRTHGVDTPDDLKIVERAMRAQFNEKEAQT